MPRESFSTLTRPWGQVISGDGQEGYPVVMLECQECNREFFVKVFTGNRPAVCCYCKAPIVTVTGYDTDDHAGKAAD